MSHEYSIQQLRGKCTGARCGGTASLQAGAVQPRMDAEEESRECLPCTTAAASIPPTRALPCPARLNGRLNRLKTPPRSSGFPARVLPFKRNSTPRPWKGRGDGGEGYSLPFHVPAAAFSTQFSSREAAKPRRETQRAGQTGGIHAAHPGTAVPGSPVRPPERSTEHPFP
jgi:hypothetical protein